MALQKHFACQIFDQDGTTFRKNIPAGLLKSPPTFNARINGGLGECVLDLNLPFDDFSEGLEIDFLYIAKIYAVDENNPRGRLIYTGWFSTYDPYLEEEEGVRVTCLGLVSLLAESYYGTSPAYSVTHTTQDPEAIAKAIIDNYNVAYGGSLIGYSGTTSAVGATVTKTLTDRTWFEALNDAKDLADGGWWWMLRESGFYFQDKPSTPTHTFTVNKDIQRFAGRKTCERVKNEIIVERNGGTRTTYTDATSQGRFGTGSPATGRRTKIIRDSTITTSGTADQRGEKELADLKDEKVRARLVINNKYDLESIKPGQTCQIANFLKASTFFGSNNLHITSVDYTADLVTIELAEEKTGLGRELEDFVNS